MTERQMHTTGSSTTGSEDFGYLFEAQDFKVLDPNEEKIGKIDEVYVGSDNKPRYLAVKMGFLGTNMTFLPVQLITRVDPDNKVVYVSVTKDMAKDAPGFDRDHQFSSEDEALIWKHYGLGRPVYVETEILIWRQPS